MKSAGCTALLELGLEHGRDSGWRCSKWRCLAAKVAENAMALEVEREARLDEFGDGNWRLKEAAGQTRPIKAAWLKLWMWRSNLQVWLKYEDRSAIHTVQDATRTKKSRKRIRPKNLA